MRTFHLSARAQKVLDFLDTPLGALQDLLSALAIVLVVINEFLPTRQGMQVPLVGWDWTTFQATMQTITWFVFVAVFATYGVTSGNLLRYAKQHWPALLICLTWIPFTEGVLIRQLHSVLSLQTLLVIGTVAHVIRMARWTSRRFSDHPLVVLCAAAVVLVTTGSALLMQVEPKTFGTFADTAWYVLMTMFTVGSSISPVTFGGRVVSAAVSILGIGLGGVFIAAISKIFTQRLLRNSSDKTDQTQRLLDENNRMLKELLASKQSGETPGEAAPATHHLPAAAEPITPALEPQQPTAANDGACAEQRKVVIGTRFFGREVDVPPEAADKDFWRMVVRYQFLYSLFGLIAGLVCVIFGLVLFIMGITQPGSSADFFGMHITDTAPGVVLFLTGLALAQITQFSVKIMPDDPPPAHNKRPERKDR